MKTLETTKTNLALPERSTPLATRRLRLWAQLLSLFISLWIGLEFYRFVRYIETGAISLPAPTRPPGVEGYLPISGLIALRDWMTTGVVNTIHPAAMIILLAAIATTFLFKKAFCSWVCPIGFISEMIADVGDRLLSSRHRPFQFILCRFSHNTSVDQRLKLPRFLDYPLRSLKYLLLAFFVYVIFFKMTGLDIRQFIDSPYNKVADIKMLKFFTDIDPFALWTIVILFALSIFLRGFWCRYLCPYGALLGIWSLASPARIGRDRQLCISCGKCTQVCPSFIKVDQVRQVVSDECSGCLDCLDVCPAHGALSLGIAGRKKPVSRRIWVLAILLVFWGTLVFFRSVGPWQNSLTTEEYRRHVERMNGAEYTHPGR